MDSKKEFPKKRQAELNRGAYKAWKSDALNHFGFFPIFQPFKESFHLRNLSGNAIRLYLYFGLVSGNETGESWVGIDSIAKYFGKSKRTISDWIKELEEAKLIERMQLKQNGVAHTFLCPYGYHLIDDENSLQKRRGKPGNSMEDGGEV